MHFLLNHPELRKDMIDTLKNRLHDADENVRYEVVMAIVTTARKNVEIVSSSEDLLEFVKERTLDKKVIFFLSHDAPKNFSPAEMTLLFFPSLKSVAKQ